MRVCVCVCVYVRVCVCVTERERERGGFAIFPNPCHCPTITRPCYPPLRLAATPPENHIILASHRPDPDSGRSPLRELAIPNSGLQVLHPKSSYPDGTSRPYVERHTAKLKALCGTILVTYHPAMEGERNLRSPSCGYTSVDKTTCVDNHMSVLFSNKVFQRLFCKFQLPHTSVNLSFTITNMGNRLTDRCENRLLQNDFTNTFCEIRSLNVTECAWIVLILG